MLRLQATTHSKYLITVKAPEIKGMHDDMSDAFARSVYLATEYLSTGGGVVKHNAAKIAGPGVSYKKYYRRHKQTSVYTHRPSSTLQTDLSRNVQGLGHISTLRTPFGRMGR
jgi:hypothetical protein